MKKKRPPYLMPLLAQGIGIAALAALMPLLAILSGEIWIQEIGCWALLPLCGLASALWVTARGLNCYLAWILPSVMMSAAPWLMIGYPPDAGSMLLCVLLSIVGAAAGDVLVKQRKK